MKKLIKELLAKKGIRLNFIKNLWYLDSFILLKNLTNESNPVIFDVGACDGSSIIDFKNLFSTSNIYSFEPFPFAFENLTRLSEKYNNVYTEKIAISNKNGFSNFYVNKSHATNSLLKSKLTNSFIDVQSVNNSIIQIETKTLDSILEERNIDKIDILKLDVQGGEILVFEGAVNALREKKIKIIYTEIWFIEGYENQPLYSDIAGFLKNFGYKPFGIYNMHYRKDGHFLWGDAIFYHQL